MVTSLLAQITAFLNLNCNKISKIAQQESTDQFESMMICTRPYVEAQREILVRSVCMGWWLGSGERPRCLKIPETRSSLVLETWSLEKSAEVKRRLDLLRSGRRGSWGGQLPAKDALQLTCGTAR